MSAEENSIAAVIYKSLDFMGYPRYRVGDDGSVWKYARSRNAWRVLRKNTHRDGYLLVSLYRQAKPKTFQVHRLVLLAFVGPCLEGMESRHFPDGDKTNNRLGNLSWGTRKQNCADKVVQGVSNHGKHYNMGEDHCRAKLTEVDVVRIREEFSSGRKTQCDLATEYGVYRATISGITRGVFWPHAGGPIIAESRTKITEDDLAVIRQMLANGETQASVARKYRVDPSTISIALRKRAKKTQESAY